MALYRLAHEAGCAEGTFWLAVCTENGDGVEKDVAEAIRLLTIAADDLNHAEARIRLGRKYLVHWSESALLLFTNVCVGTLR